MGNLQIKRIYETCEETDGCRILVDRLWPRGIAKAKAQLEEWEKEIAPSPELRKSFGHEPDLFPSFTESYQKELAANPAAAAFLEKVRNLLQQGNVILLYGAKDQEHNNAVVLKHWLETQL